VALSLSLYWYYQATKKHPIIWNQGNNFACQGNHLVVCSRILFLEDIHYYSTVMEGQQSKNNLSKRYGTEWKNSTNSKIIKVWWILAVVSFFRPIIQGGMTAINLIPEVNDEVDDIVTNPFSIISYIGATLFMLIIRQISQWQELRVHENIS
jgi:hypothetical protein